MTATQTTGHDLRPVTAFGSIRPSDIFHDRSIRKASLFRESQIRRHHAQEVCEQIEDFEHKMGWRMRSNLGPTWCERREMEREEERTMGIKRPAAPRPKEELLHYDYARPNMTPNELSSRFPTPENRLIEKGDIADDLKSEACTRKWFSSGVNSCSQPPSRNGNRTSFFVPARSSSAGPLRNSSRLWTPYSMIEPIFLPASSTQPAPAERQGHQAGERSVEGTRWEDRVGRYFWEIKHQQLMGALQRTEGNKLGHAHFNAQVLKQEHDRRVSLIQTKRSADFIAARERGEYYARIKTQLEKQQMAKAREQWQTAEAKRLGLGMDERARREEAAMLQRDISSFEAYVPAAKPTP